MFQQRASVIRWDGRWGMQAKIIWKKKLKSLKNIFEYQATWHGSNKTALVATETCLLVGHEALILEHNFVGTVFKFW